MSSVYGARPLITTFPFNMSSLDTANPIYGAYSGSRAANVSSAVMLMTVGRAMRFFNLRIHLSAVTGGIGKKYTFVFMKGGVAQSLSVVIDNGDDGSDLVNSFSAAVGDRVYIRSTPAGTPSAASASGSVDVRYL